MDEKEIKKNEEEITLDNEVSEIFVVQNYKKRAFIEQFKQKGINYTQKKLGTFLGFFIIRDSSSSSANVVNFLTAEIKKEYFAFPKRGIAESFETSLHRVNRALEEVANVGNVDWLGTIDGAVCAIDEQTMYFSVTGEAVVLLIRDNQLMSISEGLSSEDAKRNPLKTFVDVSSGQLMAGDKIIITSPDLLNLISFDELRRNALRLSRGNFIQFINTVFSNECKMAAAFVIDVNKKVNFSKGVFEESGENDDDIHIPNNVFTADVFSEKKDNTDQKNYSNNFVNESDNFSNENYAEREAEINGEYIDKRTGHIYLHGDNNHGDASETWSSITDILKDTTREIKEGTKKKFRKLAKKLNKSVDDNESLYDSSIQKNYAEIENEIAQLKQEVDEDVLDDFEQNSVRETEQNVAQVENNDQENLIVNEVEDIGVGKDRTFKDQIFDDKKITNVESEEIKQSEIESFSNELSDLEEYDKIYFREELNKDENKDFSNNVLENDETQAMKSSLEDDETKVRIDYDESENRKIEDRSVGSEELSSISEVKEVVVGKSEDDDLMKVGVTLENKETEEKSNLFKEDVKVDEIESNNINNVEERSQKLSLSTNKDSVISIKVRVESNGEDVDDDLMDENTGSEKPENKEADNKVLIDDKIDNKKKQKKDFVRGEFSRNKDGSHSNQDERFSREKSFNNLKSTSGEFTRDQENDDFFDKSTQDDFLYKNFDKDELHIDENQSFFERLVETINQSYSRIIIFFREMSGKNKIIYSGTLIVLIMVPLAFYFFYNKDKSNQQVANNQNIDNQTQDNDLDNNQNTTPAETVEVSQPEVVEPEEPKVMATINDAKVVYSEKDFIKIEILNKKNILVGKQQIIDLGDKSKYSMLSDFGNIKYSTALDSVNSILLITDKNKFVVFDFDSKKFEEKVISDNKDVKDIKGVDVFGKNIYILTDDKITKYTFNNAGLVNNSKWLKEDYSTKSVEDMTINSSIYLVKDSKLESLFSGKKNNFKLKDNQQIDLVFATDTKDFWALNKEKGTIFKFNLETGDLLDEFVHNNITEAVDFSVDENKKTALVVTADKVLEFKLEKK